MLANIDFPTTLKAHAAAVEAHLAGLIDTHLGAGPAKRLTEAMRYGLLGGGKRLRPFLVIESAGMFDVPVDSALHTAAALECVHCYSLIHDDLPAMDDDDLRRGRPSTHKAFDEATAILAGDGLLTFAFEILALPGTHADPAVRGELVLELARASGALGMAGGQMLDLAAEGRALTVAEVTELQAMKTGALIRFGCVAGAILGRASPAERAALDGYGRALGTAFQIADDLLDVEGDAAVTGKATAKDAAAGKGTLVGLLGIAGARAELEQQVAAAVAALAPFGPRGAMLAKTARFMLTRQS
jgi:farnesyl diphosphate synthase